LNRYLHGLQFVLDVRRSRHRHGLPSWQAYHLVWHGDDGNPAGRFQCLGLHSNSSVRKLRARVNHRHRKRTTRHSDGHLYWSSESEGVFAYNGQTSRKYQASPSIRFWRARVLLRVRVGWRDSGRLPSGRCAERETQRALLFFPLDDCSRWTSTVFIPWPRTAGERAACVGTSQQSLRHIDGFRQLAGRARRTR